MLVLFILIFLVLPFIFICALFGVFDSKKRNFYDRDYEDYLAEKDFSKNKNNDFHLPAEKDDYGNYSDSLYDMARDMDPEDLREEDPDLFDDIYGYEANNPDAF